MHTYRKNKDGTYDVLFCVSSWTEVLIPGASFEEAIWYVNILNGGSGIVTK